MDHVADDRPGTDDRHLDHDVVKIRRPQSRQTRHLRATFNLKHADRVGVLQCLVNCRVILRQVGQIDFFTIRVANQLDRIFQHRHHAQPQQIHFDQAQVRTIFFVPLDHHASGHRGRLERHD